MKKIYISLFVKGHIYLLRNISFFETIYSLRVLLHFIRLYHTYQYGFLLIVLILNCFVKIPII